MLARFLFFVLLPQAAPAAIGAVSVATTPTQAVLRYTAPSSAACTVEIREAAGGELVNDSNATLFTGADSDARPGSLGAGTRWRVFVAGRRSAEEAADGRWYSRALAAHTLHTYEITCGGDTAAGTFRTRNIPAGRLHNDAIPAAAGGMYAWPGIYGASRAPVTDPQTGIRIVQVTAPGDQLASSTTSGTFAAAYDASGNWTDAANVLADDANSATYSGTSSDKLFIAVDLGIFNGASYATGLNYLAWFQPQLKAWCSGVGCGGASDADRTISVCLTLDGTFCASTEKTQVLTTESATYSFGTAAPGLTDWVVGANPFDHVAESTHTGEVTISGRTVHYASGNRFRPQFWKSGTPIVLSGAGANCPGEVCLIQAVISDTEIELTADPEVSEATYTVRPFGILVWKTNSSTDEISVQFAGHASGIDYGQGLDSSPMQDGNIGCGPKEVDGGYVCGMTAARYWISAKTGEVRYLGQWLVPATGAGGGYAGNPLTICPPTLWDPANAAYALCAAATFAGETSLWRAEYHGNFSHVEGAGVVPPSCNGLNEPCLLWTRLTNSLEARLRAFSAEYAAFCCPRAITVAGQLANGDIQLQVTGGTQDTMGWFAVYRPSTGEVVAARPSYSGWPATWSGIHSAQLHRGNRVAMPLADIGNRNPGPLTGPDTIAAIGPHRVHVSAAVSDSLSACPAWPGAGATPIPESEWPSGSNCSTIVVSGEPCDPSPFEYSTGTVAISNGVATITGTSTNWMASLSGKAIVINGNTYTFTFSSSTSGTLSPTPNEDFSGAYAIQAEPADGGSNCANASDFFLRVASSGDYFYAGEPTVGLDRYDWWPLISGTEVIRLLSRSGLTWTVERGVGVTTAGNWAGDSYWYALSGMNKFDANATFNSFTWDYGADADGSDPASILSDANGVEGHGFFHRDASAGYYASASFCPVAQTAFNGTAVRQCYVARWGADGAYIADPGVRIQWAAPFAGQLGNAFANQNDGHASYDSFTSPRRFFDYRVLNAAPLGSSGSPGTQVSGDLYKYSYAQRGCSSAAQCLKLYKTLPMFGWCGTRPLADVTDPAGEIGGTTLDAYKMFVVMADGEGVAGSEAGDVLINCPGASLHYGAVPAVGTNGGDIIDVTASFAGAWTHGIIEADFSKQAPWGQRVRWLSHALARWRHYSAFANVRPTPDGGILAQAFNVEGRTVGILLLPPPYQTDSVNGATWAKVDVRIPDGTGFDGARVRFGYTTDFYCTARAEACLTDAAIAPYAFAGENLTGTPCGDGCTVSIPAISGRVLYYRVELLNNGSVVSAGPTEVLAVP